MQRPNHDPNSHTFRGRSMREAVQALKTTLGPDAVIVGTRRGRDPHGRYVEITAVGQPKPAPTPGARIDVVAGDAPAMGGRRGASAAYARTAHNTRRGAPTPELPPLLAALRGDPPAEKPFAERAAWLARQIEARTAEHARAQPPAPAPQIARRPPYHTVDALPEPPPAVTPAGMQGIDSRIMSPAQAAAELSRPMGADSEVQRLRAEIDALKDLVGGLGGRAPEVDVAAAVAEALAPLTAQLAALNRPQTQLSDIRAQIEAAAPSAPAAPPVSVPRPNDPALEQLVERLVDAGVPRIYAADIARRARPRSLRAIDPLARVSQIIADDIDCGLADLSERRVLAFVGPTGVGKTTTVAKLAARARLAGKTVALVTVDTFRMAAVDQLARYAEVLEAPLRVVKTPEALGPTLADLRDYDVVLVDTTGRNPRGAAARDLARFFPEGWGGELVLTVACGMRERDALTAVDAFAALGYAALCVTKTDESDAPGAVYGIARRSGRPVAWITDGQMVPDDIEEATAPALAARIVGHRSRGEVALSA